MLKPEGISGTYGVTGRVTRAVSAGIPGGVATSSVAGVPGTRSR